MRVLIEKLLPAKGSKSRKWLLRFATFVGVVLLIPAFQVAYVGFVNPSTTGPIVRQHLSQRIHGERETPVTLIWKDIDDVPVFFLKSLRVAEDGGFFNHHGFDWGSIQRALAESARTGKPSRGASTITQQCARSLFLWQGRSWIRKGLEAYYTCWMELLLSKKRILELYMNVIEMGKDIYGVEAAAQFYYNIPAKELTDEEASMLACILPSPRRWNPLEPDQRLRDRHLSVMKRANRGTWPLKMNDSKENSVGTCYAAKVGGPNRI